MRWPGQLFSRRRIYDDLSEEIRLHLEEKVEALMADGMSREDAYRAVQRNAMQVWENGGDFLALLGADKEVSRHLPAKRLAALFDLGYHTKHVGRIFRRVFGKN